MSTCSNCKKTLSCGCQRRVASNGVQVCSSCLGTYEASLGNKAVVNPAATKVLYQKK
jgi:hypothetical protein